MNNMILVKVLVPNSMCAGGISKIRGQYEALTAAAAKLGRLPFYDSYDVDTVYVQTALTTQKGNKVQACQAIEFSKFTVEEDLPIALLFDSYFDSSVMEEYNVDWGNVVDKEIQRAQREDVTLEDSQIWLVAAYAELE